MKRALLFSSGLTAIVVGVFTLAYLTSGASAKYVFQGRGIVKAQDLAGAQMRIAWTHLSTQAAQEFLGSAVEVSVKNAKIYARGAAGKLQRVRQGNIAVGDEVTVRGTVQTDSTMVASKVIRQDRLFVMKGKLRTFNFGNRRMTIEVSSSTYKPAQFNTKTPTFIFDAKTKFYSLGKLREAEDVTAADQKVRVEGKVVENDFEVHTMHENVL